MRAWWCLAVALFWFGPDARAQDYGGAGRPLATVYTPAEHGGHNQNWSWYQADDGLIYVAHTTGVSQWDGQAWRNLATPGDTPVRSVCQWSGDGRIYAGTTNNLGRFARDPQNRIAYQSLLDDWTFDARQFGEVWSVACVSAGVVFVTSQAAYVWDGQRVSTLTDMPPGRYRLFAIDQDIYFKPLNEAAVRVLRFTGADATVAVTDFELPTQDRLRSIFKNRNGRWVAVMYAGGVFGHDGATFRQVVAPGQLSDAPLYHATQGRDGTYYLAGLYDGLFVLDEMFQLVRRYREGDGISMDTLFSVNEDRQGTIWLTGVPNLVRFAPPQVVSQFKAGSTSTEIMSLEPAPAGMLAVGNGLFRLTANEPLRRPAFALASQSRDIYVDAYRAGDRLLYAGLYGVFALPMSDLGAAPTQLKSAGLGREIRRHPITSALYVITDQGLFRLPAVPGGELVLIPGTEDTLDSMEITADGVLWLGTATQKLYRVVDPYPAPGEPDVRRFGPGEGVPQGSITPFVWQGDVVFGTAGGVYAYYPGQRPPLSPALNVPEAVREVQAAPVLFYADPEAATPTLWFQADGPAAVFQQGEDGRWREYRNVFGRFNGNRPSTLLKTAPDTAWHIQNKGTIRRFSVADALAPPPPGLLNLRDVVDLRTGDILDVRTGRVSLTHASNAIGVRYALADSVSGHDIEYRHRLLGSDNERWSGWSSQAVADYSSLPGGDYQFEVQARDAWDRVTATGFSVAVAPPWYWSRTALALYVLAGLGFVIATSWLTQLWRTAKLTRANEALEQVVAERTADVERQAAELREQQMLKDRFFGNVSHEFRTPLTLTIGPLETLVAEHHKQLSAPVAQLATTALHNARRMLALVGQVLDMNRLEAGKLPLRVGPYDLAALVRRVHERFVPWAQEHEQTLLCEGCAEPAEYWFDKDQIDRCVSNLVSNAIKYSGTGTRIVLRLVVHAEGAGIEVADNGVGIAPDAQSRVFDRYVQGAASEQVTAPGTGIGLALVQEVMALHGGRVSLDSDEGVGSVFTLWLQGGREHFSEDQVVEPVFAPALEQAFEQGADDAPAADEALLVAASDAQDRTTLLIVDDNRELLNFMSLRLSATYRILQAGNGELGYATACRELPDLIISDVMMPVMTGLEMVAKLKATPATQTIPVILLTAKATKRETVEGFAHGADDYLTKPFDTSELIVRVNAQIAARKAIRDRLRRESAAGADKVPARATFEQQLAAVLEQHLGQTDLNVRALARHLNMSTDTLARRCKKSLGQTPLEALTRARMDRATALLNAGELSVSEVGYSVGFESLAYFSRRYKQLTGANPSDVLRRAMSD